MDAAVLRASLRRGRLQAGKETRRSRLGSSNTTGPHFVGFMGHRVRPPTHPHPASTLSRCGGSDTGNIKQSRDRWVPLLSLGRAQSFTPAAIQRGGAVAPAAFLWTAITADFKQLHPQRDAQQGGRASPRTARVSHHANGLTMRAVSLTPWGASAGDVCGGVQGFEESLRFLLDYDYVRLGYGKLGSATQRLPVCPPARPAPGEDTVDTALLRTPETGFSTCILYPHSYFSVDGCSLACDPVHWSGWEDE
ncbi:hypothetical protein AAFF_G00330790 [Aldrovandia affinis]|uniref:Uncharacterized protein n=1 Tax=Aldrovandia affinis TaxID=143900 RepID=A0AAD7W055_9TELE|nr:hypothetical protein AAFF_G00330790 [Aldrovandia affinis]